MEFLSAVVSALIGKVAEYTCNVADRSLDDYTNNVENVRAKLSELKKVKGELEVRVAQATLDGRVISEEVLKWISEAADISQKATNFLETDCQVSNIKCFGESLPNMMSRRRLSKRAKEMADVLERAASVPFSTITTRPALQSYLADRGGYEDFESRELILKEVMVSLSSDEVTKVGLYGMGGVGKTMLAQEIARRANEENLFSEVAFTTVSQVQDLKAIQQSVADKIRLDFGGVQSVVERADRLKRRLKEEKKILIILDDIWDALDLGMLGLNFDRDQPGCKIVMTSRSRYVTYNSMGSEKNISVESLGSIEARKLFTTIVGNIVFEQPETATTANDVVDECKGLPLAIKTVANALKDKELPDWEDALFQLRNSAPKNIEGMLTRVFPSIRLSYDYLESEEAKRLLLFCSLFPEDRDIKIENLTLLCVGLGLFSDIYSVAAARRRVRSLVGKLKDRCLLLGGRSDENVKMHDVIRDVVIYIASGDKSDMHSFVIDDRLEDRLSKKKSIKDAKAISLHRLPDYYNKLPETRLNCLHLELFLISSRGPLIQIKDFLQEWRNLKALFLVSANLESVPSPIHSLQNLVTLCLQHCELDDIDFIGDLKNLTVLDLSGSSIWLLPSRIRQLNRLKVLKLEDCRCLELIEENVISRLTELEELHIPYNYKNWGVGEVGSERRNANLSEWMNLQKLTSLFLTIPDAETLPKEFVFSQQLERYGLHIDCEQAWLLEEYSRGLVAKGCEVRVFGSLLNRSECLALKGSISGLKNNVVYDTKGQDFPELKYLHLDGFDDIKYLINVTDPAAVRLENLYLEHLHNLEAIWRGNPTSDYSFKRLRNVYVKDCGRLKNLFPLSITKRLHSIQVLDCEDMEEIVRVDDDASQLPIQLQLQLLELYNLPKFVGFFARSLSTEEALFTKRVAVPKLKELTLHNIGVQKIWTEELVSPSENCLQNSILERLYVIEGNNLKYLSSISDKPTTLDMLRVEKCRSLEVIFKVNNYQGGDEEGPSSSEKLSFPNLHALNLTDLPNLNKFANQFGEEEPLFNKTVALPKLKYLILKKIDVEKIWTEELLSPSDNCLQNSILSWLDVSECNDLKSLSSISDRPTTLGRLWVKKCRSLEVIFKVRYYQGGDEEGTPSSEKLSFPNLESLELIDLPNLKKFANQFVEEDQHLFNKMVFPKLENMNLSGLNIRSLFPNVEDHMLLPTTSLVSMGNLRVLKIEKCNKLKYLFTYAMAESLVNLQKLEVRFCCELEGIVTTKEYQQTAVSEVILFPKLATLQLKNLPALESLCLGPDKRVWFPNSIDIQEIENCPKLKEFSEET